MREPKLVLRRLVEHVLGKGRDLPFAMLLEYLVAVKELRRVARKFGLSPKGFRVDRAPARVLAAQLADLKDSDQLDEVVALLKPAAARPQSKASGGNGESSKSDVEALLKLRDAELARLRDELERARENARRGGEREAELVRSNERLEQELLRQRREQAAVDEVARRPAPDRSAGRKSLEQRVRQLEDEREGFIAADEALRRQLAHNQSRLRQLEAANLELEELVPKARRKKKRAAAPPVGDRRVLVPRFLPSFYKSLDGKERKAVERAIQAVLVFCTEGHAYPGLEVKQLGGQDTWSMRASLGLRVYFRPLPDGDIEVLELGNREDQHTTLRRLKEK